MNQNKKYDPRNEYKVDITKPEVQKEIKKSKELFKEFVKEYANFDMRDKKQVDEIYKKAQKKGVFEQAQNIRELIFGNETTTYGVSYISDGCLSTCVYCPIRVDAIDVDTGKRIKRKTLTIDEFVEDTKEIIKDGHSHICFLTGDGALTTYNSEKLIPYLEAADKMEGLDEIILNITPQTTEMFKKYRNAVKNKSLQFRVFQETYNREIYKEKHAKKSQHGKLGPKADYDFRRESQDRAMAAGVDNYGFGALLGLNPNPIEELEEIVKHKDEMTKKYNKTPARVCLPTANELEGVNNVQKQIYVDPKVNELMYALAKISMPEVSIVSSERDTPEMLRTLDKYASNRTVDVQPSVGGNLEQAKNKHRLLQQTTVHPTSPEATKKDYQERGYNLIFKY